MALHSAITGADNHEPKGVESASADTVYVANGSGSGTWEKISSDSIDSSTLPNLNRRYFYATIADVSNIGDFVLIPIPFNCTIVSLRYTLANAITLANSVVTVTNAGGAIIGTQTIAFSGSAEGTTFNHTPVSNLTQTSQNYIKIATDGGSTTVARLFIVLTVTI